MSGEFEPAAPLRRWPWMNSATPMINCQTHGNNAWNGELMCTSCGASYTSKFEGSVMNAPPRCRNCGERFLPIKGAKIGSHKFTAYPTCSVCFAENPGGAFQDRHDEGSPYCKGLECKFHGPQLKKLQRRAAKAASKDIAERTRGWVVCNACNYSRPSEQMGAKCPSCDEPLAPFIDIQVPGTLGLTRFTATGGEGGR